MQGQSLNYGSVQGPYSYQGQGFEAPMKSPFQRNNNKMSSFNVVGMLLSLLVPWVIFAAVYSVASLPMHYANPALVTIIVAVMGVVCLGLVFVAVSMWRRRSEGVDPSWYVFLALSSVLALVLGTVLGNANYTSNMVPYLDISNLNVYSMVDPAEYMGQQLMDAGRIQFVPGTHLDLTKSMGFRNLEMYCVAPIVTSNGTMANYDFWAVGINCCSGHAPDFHCGEFNNRNALSGLRLMREDQRDYFRLAVQQAKAAYNIKATHPIFMYWMQDPMTEVTAYQDDGFKYFLLGLFVYLAFQLLLVFLALIVFARLS